MKFLRHLVISYAGWGFFLLSLLVVAVLLGRAYQRVGEVERDDLLKEINLSLDNGIRVKLGLNSESVKPMILNKDNYPILTYGHLDSNFSIDGKVYPLWEQVFNYSVDRRNKQIFYTVSTPEDNLRRTYILEQSVKLLDKQTVQVQYFLVYNYPDNLNSEVKRFELNLAHYNQGVSGLGVGNNQIRGQTQISARRPTNGSTTFYVPFELTMKGDFSQPTLNYMKIDTETRPGFVTHYSLENPQRGKRELIATETIKLKDSYP